MFFSHFRLHMKKIQFVCNCFLPVLLLLFFLAACSRESFKRINRKAVVQRHAIRTTSPDSLNPLTVGNGKFAFTADITGMQSFPEYYKSGMSLGTLSDWAWHSFPNPADYSLNDVVKWYRVGSDSVPYWYQYESDSDERKNEATAWLRGNLHRIHLGIIGIRILHPDGKAVLLDELTAIDQQLDLWTGELTSYFEVNGMPVRIKTTCHPNEDAVSFRIFSPLLNTGLIQIRLRFPNVNRDKFSSAYSFESPEKHTTRVINQQPHLLVIEHNLDATRYFSQLAWEGTADIRNSDAHEYRVIPAGQDSLFSFTCRFSEINSANNIPDFENTADASRKAWLNFWKSGGAVDFSECTDPRAFELERRMVLSQYLTRVQCTGYYPPQETGLTFNSWYGKFHLEMHWWHALHFMLWNRTELIDQQFTWYDSILPAAKRTAELQGYKGIRWPKMTDPSGRESPSSVGTFLIWQQPHPVYYAEWLYQNASDKKKILDQWFEKVTMTADFMASYARFDSVTSRYILGPAVIPAQECFMPETTINPSFELAYWYWGLQTAQIWRVRMGLPPDPDYEKVISGLAPLPVRNGRYLFSADATDSYTNPDYLTDHPMVLGILGMLPLMPYTDTSIMRRTAEAVYENWKWETTWGWDMPMAAINATALGNPEKAVELLFLHTQKNTYLTNGHNYQSNDLPVYLPGNAGLLSAIAMMCTWRDPEGKNGFPDNGKWNVRYENLSPWIRYELY